jgi:hypothetical protein
VRACEAGNGGWVGGWFARGLGTLHKPRWTGVRVKTEGRPACLPNSHAHAKWATALAKRPPPVNGDGAAHCQVAGGDGPRPAVAGHAVPADEDPLGRLGLGGLTAAARGRSCRVSRHASQGFPCQPANARRLSQQPAASPAPSTWGMPLLSCLGSATCAGCGASVVTRAPAPPSCSRPWRAL